MQDDATPRPPSDTTATSKASTNSLIPESMTSGEDSAAGPPTTDRATDPDADPLTEPATLDPGSEDVATAGEGLAPLPSAEKPSAEETSAEETSA